MDEEIKPLAVTTVKLNNNMLTGLTGFETIVVRAAGRDVRCARQARRATRLINLFLAAGQAAVGTARAVVPRSLL